MSEIRQRIYGVLRPVVRVLDELQVPYFVGGSVASSIHGVPRTTIDADIVADLKPIHVHRFVTSLDGEYYVSPESVRDAVAHRESFNLVQLSTMMKADVFVLKARLFDQESMRRRVFRSATGDPQSLDLYLTSPEDIILNKLEWYRMGDEVSERQWQDVVNVIKVQEDALDNNYLDRWATELNVTDLLTNARAAAR